MKRLTIALFALLLMSPLAQAQLIPVDETTIELEETTPAPVSSDKIGLNVSAALINSQMAGMNTKVNDRQRLTSFAVAATKEFELSDKSSLETGLGVEQLGDEFGTTRQLTPGVTARYTSTYELNYATIPFNYNYQVGGINQMGSLFLTGGLRFGFLLGAYRTDSIDSKRRDISAEFRKFDPRFTVGAGVKAGLSSNTDFLAKLEYQRSFARITKASYDTNVYNDSVGLSVGIGL